MSVLLRSRFLGAAEEISTLVAAVIKDFLMRVQHWISPILGLLAILAGTQETWAQYNSDPNGSPGVARVAAQPAAYAGAHYAAPGNPYDQAMMSPEMYGGYPPAYTPVSTYPFEDAGAYGQAMQPWPTISPFDYGYQSHQVQGGLWTQITHGFGKQWYARAEYLSTRTRKPEGILGDTHTQSYFSQEFPALFSLIPNNGGNGGTSSGGDGGGDGGGTTDSSTQPDGSNANFFNRLDLHALGDIFGKGGRFSGGWWNPDSSGVGASFWFTGDSKEVFDARKDVGRVQNNLEDLHTILTSDLGIFSDLGQENKFDVIQSNLLNLRGLPVNDGSVAGIVIPYDLYFTVTNRSQSLGANIDSYFSPIVDRKNVKVRPMAGARFLRIDEAMEFVGIDSGMLYTDLSDNLIRDLKSHPFPNRYDDNANGIIDEAGVTSESGDSGGGGGGGGGSSQVTYGPPINDAFAFTRSFVDMSTQSNLYGPEVGLRYDLGGEKFKIWGETKLGVAVNKERIKLKGDNIGSITRSAFNGVTYDLPETGTGDDNNVPPFDPPTEITENDPGLFTPTAGNPHPNAFQDEETHTHFSPLFEQSFFLDANIFGYVPVLRDIKVFERANFQLGYTFIWANQIATTDQSIVWDGKPTAGLFPHISIDRETWWTSNYSFGVSWDF